jgi:hypothetical protein
MKNLFLILALASFTVGCGDSDKKATDTTGEEVSGPSHNTDAFNESFDQLLSSYYNVKDGLVDYDTAKVNAAAAALAKQAESLPLAEISNDSTGVIKETAKSYTNTITGSATGLAAEASLDQKKREFQLISDAMYNLVRTVRYDREKIYYQHCPMAFGDEEAYWLSNSREIVNPYLGKQHPKYKAGMLHCGDITDSIGFTR